MLYLSAKAIDAVKQYLQKWKKHFIPQLRDDGGSETQGLRVIPRLCSI